MNFDFQMLAALVAGILMGILFFGGLWITVKKGLASGSPALWFLLSFILRSAIVLTGFYFISRWGLTHILIAVSGFIISRFIIKKALPSETPSITTSNEIKNEA